MGLTVVKKFIDITEDPISTEGFGYKVFDCGMDGQGLPCSMFSGDRWKALTIGEWLFELDWRIALDKKKDYIVEMVDTHGDRHPIRYRFGWHVYTRKSDATAWGAGAKRWKIYKVEYRNIVAKGLHYFEAVFEAPVTIVQYLKLIGEV